MSHTVVIQRRAQRDILVNSQRIESERSFSASMRWFDGIRRAIDSLAQNPERCPLADEADDFGFDLRILIHGRKRQVFRILFIIDGVFVHVLRVRHASQDYVSFDELT
jgi:plasmid stabilization system protein ParE